MKNSQKGSPRFLFGEAGIVPIIAIIITFAIIGGAAVVVQREVKKQQQNKTTNSSSTQASSTKETKDQIKDTKTTPSKVELSKDSFVLEPKEAGLAEPGFSIIPPSGWIKVNVSGNYKVIFESPDEDKLMEIVEDSRVDNVWLGIKPRVSVFVSKARTTYLDNEVSTVTEDAAKQGISVVKLEKTKLNGEDAYYYEGIQKMEGTKVAGQFKEQLELELLKLGQGVSEKDIQSQAVQSKISKVISNFVFRNTGYFLYKDGYAITISSRSLNSFWDKREPQINASLKTFKILSALDKAVSEEEALKGFPDYSKAKLGSFTSNGATSLPKFNLNIPSGWMQKIMQGDSYYRAELRPANKYNQSWISVAITKSGIGTVDNLPRQAESKRDEKITKSGIEGRVIEYTQNKYSDTPQRVLTYSFIADGYLTEISAVVPERDWTKLEAEIKSVIDSFGILTSVDK